MAGNSTQSAAASAYARALLELANEQKQAEPVGRELAQLRELLESNPSFVSFLRDPGISKTERGELIEKLFKGKVSPLLYNTLAVMNSHGRLPILGAVARTYQSMLDTQLGRLDVDVTVAQKLSSADLDNVRQRISEAFGKEAILHQREDPSIIGGLVLRVGDKLIDGSVRAQLELMRRKLLGAAR